VCVCVRVSVGVYVCVDVCVCVCVDQVLRMWSNFLQEKCLKKKSEFAIFEFIVVLTK